MAKGRRASTRANMRKRSRKNFVAMPFDVTNSLLTLGSAVVDGQAVHTGPFGEDIYLISADTLWSIRNATQNEGPIEVGFAHGDLTDTEVKEGLEVELTDPDDIIAKERSRRPIRRAGIFPLINVDEVLNNGVPLRTPIKFSVGDGHDLNVYAFNHGGQSLTSGAQIKAQGTLYGRWQR